MASEGASYADLATIQDLLGDTWNYHNPALLQGLQPQGQEGLLQGHGAPGVSTVGARLEPVHSHRKSARDEAGCGMLSHGWNGNSYLIDVKE